ncbi:zinc finger protein 12-like [Contarinia nasturtii]|uniref:zinc finger protein 12-like n=1 Tax=Contarinia nasturtii TaxID=265458 RepID=UPI0012D42F34|nr:zinc finger protein 12-like [Contarinia nasturtii]
MFVNLSNVNKCNKMMKTENQSSSTTISDGMCRLCTVQCDDENSVEIFDINEQSLTIRIMACAGLEVTQQDALPKRVCLECRLVLEKSFLFRTKCKNSDLKLRRHFRLINAGKVSHVFDDSEDEFEDEYTESMKVIDALEKRLEEKQKTHEIIEKEIEEEKKEEIQTSILKPLPNKGHTNEQDTLGGSSMQTRSSNRLKNTTETKSILMENGTIEVLMEEVGDDGEIEYVFADEVDEPFQSTDSDDIEDPTYEIDPFTAKNDDIDMSEDSMDDKSMDTDYNDASLLESILPTIKESVAAKNGTILDDKTQYKIIRTTDNEIKVQCISSDGKEFEIEMMSQPHGIERDESGDLKIFSCSKCPKTFSRRGKLINHERDHNAKTSGQECPYCQKWFPSNSTLTRHIRVHTGEKPFKCNICDRNFIQKEILKRHLMTHSGERPFKCSHCPKSFILKEALRQHINRNHTENPVSELHNCPFCPKSFCHSSGLSRHLLIHAGRTFSCEYCHKKFNDKSALKRHTTSIHESKSKK